jgi:uncharacterized membrane protein
MGLLRSRRETRAAQRAHYNRAAGRSPMRLAELADGVFAIAMTLLVLELHAPAVEAIRDNDQLREGLLALGPKLATWAMSFLTLGIFWVAQSTQIETLARSDRDQTWLHLAFLAAVSLVPFTTVVLGEFPALHIAMLVYWANIVALGGLLFAAWSHARRRDMLIDSWTDDMMAAINRRLLMSQGLYLAAALVSLWRPLAGLALMLVVQLNYAVAPRFGRWLG